MRLILRVFHHVIDREHSIQPHVWCKYIAGLNVMLDCRWLLRWLLGDYVRVPQIVYGIINIINENRLYIWFNFDSQNHIRLRSPDVTNGQNSW